jgi:cob(I)alamin adenosyltransferase
MSKIYTKTGDKGETGLFGGKRVRKDSPRIVAYGEVDELNAFIGGARTWNDDPEVDRILQKIQNNLFDIGAVLASPDKKRLEGKASGFIRPEDVGALEEAIDRLDQELPPLRNFILPGGSELAAQLHIARTVCRRAERSIVALAEKEPGSADEEILRYINRLSDFLFVLARWVNFKKGAEEARWEKK